eukprot:1195927-Prorocentrum_minimum.AAC.2
MSPNRTSRAPVLHRRRIRSPPTGRTRETNTHARDSTSFWVRVRRPDAGLDSSEFRRCSGTIRRQNLVSLLSHHELTVANIDLPSLVNRRPEDRCF